MIKGGGGVMGTKDFFFNRRTTNQHASLPTDFLDLLNCVLEFGFRKELMGPNLVMVQKHLEVFGLRLSRRVCMRKGVESFSVNGEDEVDKGTVNRRE